MPKRVKAANEALEKAGGKFLSWYLTMGQSDAVAVVEVPDDATGMQVLLNLGSQGDIRTTTLKAFTLQEATEIIEKLP